MAEKIQFFPLDANYKTVDGKAVINLYGRTPDGKQVCILDSSFEPYFYVIPKDSINISERLEKIRIENENGLSFVTKTETAVKKILGKDVFAIKVYVNLPAGVPVIRSVIKEWDIVSATHEFDIPFARRYLIDKNTTPLVLQEAAGEFISQKSKAAVFRAESITQASIDTLHSPRILAFDIETYSHFDFAIDSEKNPILMLSFYGEGLKKVFVWKKFETDIDYIEFVETEAQLIEKFKETIDNYKPDILTGYFSDGFDLPYIKTRADMHKVKLDIGWDYSELRVKNARETTVAVNGITHLDIFKFIKRVIGGTLETYSYDLNAVASELLDEKKQDVPLADLPSVWDRSPENLGKFCEYNLHDSFLTYSLAVKMLPTITEIVKIVGIPVYDITRMGFSQLVEWYILKQAHHFNEIAPNKPDYNEVQQRRLGTYQGAFVYEPKPGLYKDIVVFDFRSLYPTILSSHNIGPDTINCACCRDTAKPAPADEGKKYWFCSRRKGFIPSLIEDLITRRMRIKEIIKEEQDEKFAFLDARQNSLKLLANSFYGYLGFFGARWYSLECARSITAWGRHYIHKVIDKAQKQGFFVLYSDSLPYDRHLFVKFKNGDIKMVKIGELYDNYKDTAGISTLAFDKSGNTIFKSVIKVIRHDYSNALLKINTTYGSTVVTPQHSVYSYDYKDREIILVDAKELKKGDKLISLTNPQINAIYKKCHVFDAVDLDFENYSKELVLYTDNLLFPNKKGYCPYCKKSTFLSSHVFLRHPERRHPLDKNSLFGWLGGKNAKTRKMPRYWALDEELAWLLGFYCAEGSVSDILTKSGRKCILSFGNQDRKIIEAVKSILDAKTGTAAAIIENFDKRISKKIYYYRVQCMPIVALFQYGFGCGKGSEFKKVPWFIFTAEEALRKAFVKGYLDGDGNTKKDSRYATRFVRFSTKSKELAIGLDFLLKGIRHFNNFHGKEIKHVAWQYRKDKPKIQTLRLQSAKESKGNYCLAEIRSIEEVNNEKYVYDLEVEDVHNFVDAEGMILVHNTDSVFLTLDGRTKQDAGSFAESINTELPGLMELELQGFYPSGIFVSAKIGQFGAKKKYALMSENGALRIKGFETVRRNWSLIAKDVQEKVLEIILREHAPEKALEYAKMIINDLRGKKIPMEKVVIHTQLQKEILDYTARGPHVAVAQRLKNKGIPIGPGSTIKYIVTHGSDIISSRSRMPEEVKEGEYDADYYINNQVIPSVERIFNVLGYKKEDLLETKEQTKLEGFFRNL